MGVVHVRSEGAQVLVRSGQLRVQTAAGRHHLPLETLRVLVLWGRSEITAEATRLILSAGHSVMYVSRTGRFQGMTSPPLSGSGHVRLGQAQVCLDSARSLELAQALITTKLRNEQVLLKRRGQPHAQVADALRQVKVASSSAALMGAEGQAGREYLQGLWASLPEDWRPERRSRRPPLDPVNAALGLLYAFLLSEVTLAIHAAGLDPYLGVLHGLRPGKPSLALDLMEEFRTLTADSVLVTLLGRQQLLPEHFETLPGGAVHANSAGFATLLRGWDDRLSQELFVPSLGGQSSYRNLIAAQARLLARHMLGDAQYAGVVTR